MPPRASRSELFGKRWVHAFEEDSAAGEVYRPSGSALPLSRRPRRALELRADGSATIHQPGPADRAHPVEASWKKSGDTIVVRATDDSAELRVVSHTNDRLVVASKKAK